jgi:hypothetical protein
MVYLLTKVERCESLGTGESMYAHQMITIAHVLVGGTIGVATQNPALALIGGVASHFVLDMLPHLDVPPGAKRDKDQNLIWEPSIWLQAFGDVGLSAALIAALWYSYYSFPAITPFVIGAFAGFLPDLIDNVPFWNKPFRASKLGRRFHNFHEWTHITWIYKYPMKRYAWLGILTQVITIGACLRYLIP